MNFALKNKIFEIQIFEIFALKILKSNVQISGEEMLRSGSKYVLDHQTGVLIIKSVSQAGDKGVYTCTVRDRQGHTARRDFTLDVVGKLIQTPKLFPAKI